MNFNSKMDGKDVGRIVTEFFGRAQRLFFKTHWLRVSRLGTALI